MRGGCSGILIMRLGALLSALGFASGSLPSALDIYLIAWPSLETCCALEHDVARRLPQRSVMAQPIHVSNPHADRTSICGAELQDGNSPKRRMTRASPSEPIRGEFCARRWP